MLDFEVALARAQAAIGVIPASALDLIAQAARAEHFDAAALANDAADSGNIAEQLVRALIELVKKNDAAASACVHHGAGSHDLLDTGLVLDLKAAVDQLIADLGSAIDGFMKLTGRHRRTAAVSRPYLQHALPVPFGLKLASYAAALARSRERLRRLRREAPSARWMCWMIVDQRLLNAWPLCLICRSPRRLGTAIEIGSRKWRQQLPFSPAPAERSRAMWRF